MKNHLTKASQSFRAITNSKNESQKYSYNLIRLSKQNFLF